MVSRNRKNFDLVRRRSIDENAASPSGVKIEHLTHGSIIQIIAGAGTTRSDVEQLLPDQPDLRTLAPGQWLHVSETELDRAALDHIARVLEPIAHVVDQSHGRTRIRISGPRARGFLGCWASLDLHPDVFAIRASTNTMLGHISANLSRTGEDEFEAIVLSTFAQSLWDDLTGH
jgi:sarcosine oxidase subunit gamma